MGPAANLRSAHHPGFPHHLGMRRPRSRVRRVIFDHACIRQQPRVGAPDLWVLIAHRVAHAITPATYRAESVKPQLMSDRGEHTGSMAVRLHHVVVDAHDLPGLARFWAQALGWRILSERAQEVVIGPGETAPIGMCFMPVPETKTIKNRVHLDLTTGADDRDAEIERLLRLGARRVNVGQTGEESWTVLADPEGNEFCVVRPKITLIE